MPRTVDPLLKQMYERANPNVCEFVEIAQPDVGQVLRRWVDQFSTNPPRVSETPASTTQQSPGGGMMLKATLASLAAMDHDDAGGLITLGIPDQSRIIRGVGWSLADNLKPIRLRRFTAKIKPIGTLFNTQFELQIYRMRGVPGRVITSATGAVQQQLIQYTPTPLLPQPIRASNPYLAAPAGPFGTIDLVFDLVGLEFDAEHRNVPAPSLTTVGEVPELIFEIWITNPQATKYEWRIDNTSTRVISGIGTFADVQWEKDKPPGTPAPDPSDPTAQWVRTAFARVPAFRLDIDTYPATSQEVYAITLPRVPGTPTTGRIVFLRENPAPLGDGGATLELSTAGSGGPWTAVSHGDVVSTKQTTYHLRATLNGSADTHRSPVVEAVGIEFRTPRDVTAECTVEPIPQDVNVPFGDSAIGEGKVTVMKTGRKDYRDPASDILTAAAATQLEIDHYLGSFHPAIGRAQWFHVGRYSVTAAQGTQTSEIFSLLSYAKILKRKIPARAETVNTILTVASATVSSITSTTDMPGTTVTPGDEYDGLNYFVRPLATATPNMAGNAFPVQGNTGKRQLDFVSPFTGQDPLPGVMSAGDTYELHSGSYGQPKLSWANADPADVWLEIESTWLGVPPERIGRADLGVAGRAGRPPKLTDRAPGDTATQNKLRVSLTLRDFSEAKELIDQLSFIMQGTTLEIGGQICFVSIYPLYAPDGSLVLQPSDIAATFDVRDYSQLDTPRGLESRVTLATCNYGVDSALGSDAPQPSTVLQADATALDWFKQQDIEEISSSIPDGIARWCYNTYDGGLYLASQLCQQVVRACSTGMRLWSWTTVDAHPELCVGDRVIVITDQVADYDPLTRVAIRGLWSFPLVLVHVGRGGREFRGYMLGLSSAAVLGGSGTLSVGPVGQPSIGNIDFNAAGELLVTVNQGTPPGGGFRLAASTAGMPTDATVDAASFTPGQTGTINLGGGWTAGAQVQVKVIAYASADVNGARSLASTGHATVIGGSATIFIDTLAQGSPNYAANTIPLSWVGHGVIASYDVYVSESLDGAGASYVLAGPGVTSPYTFTSSYDIATSGSHSVTVSFYVVGKNGGGAIIATSPANSHSYIAKGI